MSTTFIPVRVDMRGSINIPAVLKTELVINLGAQLLLKRVNGVIIMVPLQGEAEQAFEKGTLHEWIGQQLDKPMAPVQVQPSKMAVAESIRLQHMRERFEHKRRLLELELQILNANYVPKQSIESQPDPDPANDPIAKLRAGREAESNRQIQAAAQQAGQDLLPQAPTE
jgi:bifunctional DNA-binding transcriptional regulator/antitoxin component of YhaV-PrlF toxin-antitoxin module